MAVCILLCGGAAKKCLPGTMLKPIPKTTTSVTVVRRAGRSRIVALQGSRVPGTQIRLEVLAEDAILGVGEDGGEKPQKCGGDYLDEPEHFFICDRFLANGQILTT